MQQPFWPKYALTPVSRFAHPAEGTPALVPGTNVPAMGSYYESSYYRNPVPYTHSDIGEPVPGWGTTVSVAGPARLGVGAFGQADALTKLKSSLRMLEMIRDAQAKSGCGGKRPCPTKLVLNGIEQKKADIRTMETSEAIMTAVEESEETPPTEVGGLPWWVWPVAAGVVLTGVGFYGTKKGWF